MLLKFVPLRPVALPRQLFNPARNDLCDRGVIAQAIVKGAGTRDFFGTAYGEHDGKFDGFMLGDANVQFDDTLLLIEPDSANAYEAANQVGISPLTLVSATDNTLPVPPGTPFTQSSLTAASVTKRPKSFHGSATVAPAAAKMRFVQIADEIIAILAADPNAEVKIRIEVEATFPNTAQDQTKRAVSENAKTLGFSTAEWE